MRFLLAAQFVAFPLAASAQAAVAADGRGTDWIAIGMFVAIALTTLVITYRSAGRTKSRVGFYTAGHAITPLQNGLAIAGDFLSAAAFLGISALVYSNGFDGFLYALGFLTGWPIVLFLMSERLRNLGSYTFADAAAFRLDRTPIRLVAAIGSLVVVLFYLVAQMIGAGKVIELLFGVNYLIAVTSVGVPTIPYVTVGGMQATTWVQITKAALLLCGGTLLGFVVLWRFDFSVRRAVCRGQQHSSQGRGDSRAWRTLRRADLRHFAGLALVFGTAGLPHILMRFFTVKDAADARKSVFYATSCVAYFCLVIPILGIRRGADPDVRSELFPRRCVGAIQQDHRPDRRPEHGVDPSCARGRRAGSARLHFGRRLCDHPRVSSPGLTLAGCSAIGHDIYGQVIAKGRGSDAREVWVSKVAAVGIGVAAVLLAYSFENQNVAFMAGLALSVAASCNFPVLATAIFWRGTTTRGAVTGALAGLISSVVLVVFSKTVWVAVFNFKSALFPYENPALFSMPLAFLFIWLFSITDRSARAARERKALRRAVRPVRDRNSARDGGPRVGGGDAMSNERKTMKRHIRWLGYAMLGGILMAARFNEWLFGASTKEDVEVTSTPLAVEHIVIKTMKPYPEVKARIEKLGRFDEGMRAMLAKNDIDGLREAAERIAGADGLAIHYVALHGDLLALRGERRPLIAYYIGNILSASEMTKVNPAAGLDAPLRVVVYANAQGGTTMEYDRPTSMFGQFKSAEIDAVAKSLDDRLLTFLKKAGT